ncbi:MAG: hypothetical protein ACRDZP_00320 [Acidimicrobiales bacterium]
MALTLGAIAIFTAACGAGGNGANAPKTTASPSSRPVSVRSPEPAGRYPSKSARMICDAELQKGLAYSLGERTTTPPKPTWVHHLYTCRYLYRSGVMTLSVKELSSASQTSSYFEMLQDNLGDAGRITGLGDGAFSTRDGSIVARKDWKILLVDISRLPGRFGRPATTRAEVAVTVADSILACWSGD